MRRQPSDDGLLEPHEEHEGEQLPAVRVPGELQVHPQPLRQERRARLVRQQQARHALGSPRERQVRTARVRRIHPPALVVRHARHDEPRLRALDDAVLVVQHGEPQPRHLGGPRGAPVVVLVVAGDVVDAERRAQPGQRRHLLAQRAHAAVHQISRHRDDVRLAARSPAPPRAAGSAGPAWGRCGCRRSAPRAPRAAPRPASSPESSAAPPAPGRAP